VPDIFVSLLRYTNSIFKSFFPTIQLLWNNTECWKKGGACRKEQVNLKLYIHM